MREAQSEAEESSQDHDTHPTRGQKWRLPTLTSTTAAVAAGLLTVGILYYSTRKADDQGHNSPLVKLPLIGDLHKSPVEQPLVNWDAWCKENGPVISTNLMGVVPVVLLNTS